LKPKFSLEARLNLSIVLIMIFIIGLGFFWAIHDARHSVRQEAGASMGLALGLIDASLLSGDLKPSGIHSWIERIRHLDRIRHLKILVSASRENPQMGQEAMNAQANHSVPSWFRWAVVSEPLVVVREVRLGSDQPVYIHVESYAEDEVREAWDEVLGFLMLQAIMLMAIYLAVHSIASRALRPVGRIIEGLSAMEEGDYDNSLPRFGLTELDRISSSINHLSSTLRTSRDENRALTRHSLSIQEDERRGIAQEIHDEFGQNLTAIKMMSGAMVNNPGAGETANQEIQRLCDRLFGVVRSLMRRLRPMVLEDLGLRAAISDLRDHWKTMSPDLEVVIHYDSAVENLRGETGLAIYRIIQEALTNTLRHSGASQMLVRIEAKDLETILLVIQDNGCGMSKTPQQRGFGLLGMRERVSSLMGQFKLINRPGEGLEIRILLPLQKSKDD
jgi:two-component system, NarL family, sensor histidine kinase UhpB